MRAYFIDGEDIGDEAVLVAGRPVRTARTTRPTCSTEEGVEALAVGLRAEPSWASRRSPRT